MVDNEKTRVSLSRYKLALTLILSPRYVFLFLHIGDIRLVNLRAERDYRQIAN